MDAGAALGVGDDPARARHRQRRVRGRGQPRRPRRSETADRVLGPVVRRRSVRRDLAEGVVRPRRRSWSSSAIARRSRRCGRTGRSCAIGASTPTAASISRRWHRRDEPTRRPPRRLRMPAEWDPHAATWLAWPHNDPPIGRASSRRSRAGLPAHDRARARRARDGCTCWSMTRRRRPGPARMPWRRAPTRAARVVHARPVDRGSATTAPTSCIARPERGERRLALQRAGHKCFNEWAASTARCATRRCRGRWRRAARARVRAAGWCSRAARIDVDGGAR